MLALMKKNEIPMVGDYIVYFQTKSLGYLQKGKFSFLYILYQVLG